MNIQEIQKKIELALEAVGEMKDRELMVSAFGVVLNSYLTSPLPNKSMSAPHKDLGFDHPSSVIPRGKESSVLSSLSITKDQLSEIYNIDGENLKLRVKINDLKNAEQQRKLAQTVLFGYKVILDAREVPGSKLLMVARGWDIPTDHFAKNVQSSEYIQIRNVGKGKDPIYSLRPGALDKLVEEVKALVA